MKTIAIVAALLLLAGAVPAGDILTDTPDHEWAQMRLSMPSYDQDRFFKKHGCTPNSLANGLLWWHSLGIVDLAKARRSKKDSLEDVAHGVAASALGTNSRGSTKRGSNLPDRMLAAASPYLRPEYQAAVQYYTWPDGFDRLNEIVKGANVCILRVDARNKRTKNVLGHSVLLCQADRSGGLVFHTWGEVYRYRLPMDRKPSKRGLLLEPIGEGSPTHDFLIGDDPFTLTVIEPFSPVNEANESAPKSRIAQLQYEIFIEKNKDTRKRVKLWKSDGDALLDDGTVVPNPKKTGPRR
jgi:hypothetical protein